MCRFLLMIPNFQSFVLYIYFYYVWFMNSVFSLSKRFIMGLCTKSTDCTSRFRCLVAFVCTALFSLSVGKNKTLIAHSNAFNVRHLGKRPEDVVLL